MHPPKHSPALPCSSSLEEEVGKPKVTKEDDGPKGGDGDGKLPPLMLGGPFCACPVLPPPLRCHHRVPPCPPTRH